MDRIAKLALIFKVLFIILIVTLPLFTFYVWSIFPDKLGISSVKGFIAYNPLPLPISIPMPFGIKMRALSFLINMLSISCIMAILFQLICLFGCYARKEVFSLANTKYLKRTGYLMILWQMFLPVQKVLISLLFTWQNEPGQRIIQTSFSADNITIIIFALVVILVSSVMAQAHKIQEEQAYTV